MCELHELAQRVATEEGGNVIGITFGALLRRRDGEKEAIALAISIEGRRLGLPALKIQDAVNRALRGFDGGISSANAVMVGKALCSGTARGLA